MKVSWALDEVNGRLVLGASWALLLLFLAVGPSYEPSPMLVVEGAETLQPILASLIGIGCVSLFVTAGLETDKPRLGAGVMRVQPWWKRDIGLYLRASAYFVLTTLFPLDHLLAIALLTASPTGLVVAMTPTLMFAALVAYFPKVGLYVLIVLVSGLPIEILGASTFHDALTGVADAILLAMVMDYLFRHLPQVWPRRVGEGDMR